MLLISLLLLLLLLRLWLWSWRRRRMIILRRLWCLWRSLLLLLWDLLWLWLLLLKGNELAHLWYFIKIDIRISWLRLFWHRNRRQIIKKVILIEISSHLIIRIHTHCLLILLQLHLFLFYDCHIVVLFFFFFFN